jgi:hypothetical protein
MPFLPDYWPEKKKCIRIRKGVKCERTRGKSLDYRKMETRKQNISQKWEHSSVRGENRVVEPEDLKTFQFQHFF